MSILTQEYAGKSIALPNVVQSSQRKFNSYHHDLYFVYWYTRGRTVERAVVWNGCKTLRAVSLRVLVRECTNERFDARIRRQVDCLTQHRAKQ